MTSLPIPRAPADHPYRRAALLLALFLPACGGGGDAVSPESEPAAEPTPMETTMPPTDPESDLPTPGPSAVLMRTSVAT